jgi:hypothetical protein
MSYQCQRKDVGQGLEHSYPDSPLIFFCSPLSKHSQIQSNKVDEQMIYTRIKKVENQGKKCHTRTMMYSEVGESFKMNTHHVSFSQSVEEIGLGKE